LRRAAPGIQPSLSHTGAKKSHSPAIPDTDKQIQVESQSFGAGKVSAKPTVLIAEFD
jgi:hypothetical protein